MDEIIDALATFRLARLITQDTFPPARAFREAVWRLFPDAGVALDPTQWKIQNDRAERVVWWNGLSIRVNVRVADRVVIEPHPIGELVSCMWCASIYVAFGVVIARRVAPRAWRPAAKALAASGVAGIAASVT